MRRNPLPPPQQAPMPVEIDPGGGAAVARTDVRPAHRPEASLDRDALPDPVPASPSPRRFDPKTSKVRSAERELNKFVSRNLYPRIPLIDVPYSAMLDRGLGVSEAVVRLAGLHPDLSGLKILLVTDIHVGPLLKPAALERAFDKLLGLEPDLIVLGGDIATSRLDEFDRFAPAFHRLHARLGVFAVLGNHDHYTRSPYGLMASAERTGVRFLHNDSVVIEHRGGRLILAGIDDLLAGRPDLDAALARSRDWRGPGPRPPVILASHNPDIFFQAARRGVGLVLSGHTHGGQIRIPGLPVIVRQSRYRLDAGRYAVNGSEIVVSRGLGVAGLPLRVACPPEAVLLELA